MKTVKYILFVIAVMTAVSMSAQIMAQEPVAHFQSTSSMVGSGSTLPQAAYSGPQVAGSSPASYSAPSRPRRAYGSGEDEETLGGNEDKPNQVDNPIGELPWLVMVVLAGAYAILRRRKRAA